MVYDLKTRSKRTIPAGDPPCGIRIMGWNSPVVLTDVRWSSDGRSLVCSYFQGQLAEVLMWVIDITTKKPVWRKLPIEPSGGFWAVVDKMPTAHCN